MTPLRLTPFDQLIAAADRALRTLAADPQASRASPAGAVPAHATAAPLSEPERREAAALMRVNHVGEVCAQAMYDAQALASSPALRETFVRAAQEEADHLAWTQQRIGELGGRTSLLNPLWYSGAFAIGWLPRGWAIESAWASWPRPSARLNSICKAILTGCPRPTSNRAPSSSR